MKTSLKKNEVALLQTLSRLFYLVQFVKCWQFFLELNSKRLYRSSEKEEESRWLVYTSSSKSSVRHFHVAVIQWRQRNVQKSVIHVQSCCFANRNLLLSFMLSSLTSPSSLLKHSNRDRVNEASDGYLFNSSYRPNFSGHLREVHLPWLGLYNILIFSLHFLFIVLECRKSVFQCWFGMLCILQGNEIT